MLFYSLSDYNSHSYLFNYPDIGIDNKCRDGNTLEIPKIQVLNGW